MTRFGMRASLAFALLAAGGFTGAQAQDGRNAMLGRLADCRKINEDAQRLACFDQAASALEQAEAKGDIVVVDREQARTARRQAFGFNLPSLSIFDRGEAPEEVDRVSETIASSQKGGDDKWLIVLQSGAVWVQTDSEPLAKPPRQGQKAEIRRAALGSYFVNIDGQRALRMRRTK